jgi:hypothetical protein
LLGTAIVERVQLGGREVLCFFFRTLFCNVFKARLRQAASL